MIKTDDINDQAITKDKIRDGNVTAEKLADGAVSTDKLPDGAIKTPKIADENITTSKLAEASVVTSKIADQNVTKEKIADHSVDNSKLSPEAVTYDKLKDKSVITEKLNDRAVTTDKIEEKAITNAKIGDSAVDGRVISEASVEKKHLANDSVATEKLQDGAITSDKIHIHAVTEEKIDDSAISNSKLADNSVGTSKIKDGNVTNEKVANNTITIDKFDPELRKSIQAATGLPENLVEVIQDVDVEVKSLHSKDEDLQSQIADKQQQITANDKDIESLQNRSTQMEQSINNIAVTGGASVANTVTYSNTASGLVSINAQGAIDELAAKKFDKESILQESGDAEDKVMSQKAVSDKLSGLSLCVDTSIENALSNKFDNITIDGNTLTIGKAGFSLFSLGARTSFEGTEDLIFTSNAGIIRKSLYLNPKYIGSGGLINFTEHSDVFVEVTDGTYNGILFAEWYLGTIVNAGLVSSILNKTKIDKANAEIDKANVLLNDRTKAQVYVLDNNIPYIEEDVVNKKVYLRFDVIGVRGITNRTLYREQLYNELSVDAVTSPKGESNCFVLDDGYDLLYDTIGKVFKIASRHDVVSTDLVLVAQVAGSVIYLSNNLSAQYVYSKLSGLSLCVDTSIENALSNKFDNITIDGNTLTIGKAGFSLFSLGARTSFEGTEDLIFTSNAGIIRKSLYLNPKYIGSGGLINFTEHSDVFVEVTDGTYNGILFAEWYLGTIVNAGLVSSILNKTKIDKANAEIDKANVLLNDRTKAQVYVLDNNIPYIEEDVVNKKVYLRFDVIGVRGITNRTLYREQLYNELSVDAVTSPKGESNCFVLDDGYDLLYDTIGKVFKIASRHDVVSTDLVLVAQVAGSVIYLSNNLSAQYFYSELSDLSLCVDTSIENALSGTFNNITIDGNTLTIGKAGFSLFSLGIRTAFDGTEDLIFTSNAGIIRKSLYLNPKYIGSGGLINFTEHSDVFVEVTDGTYNGILFAEWYLGTIVNAGLVSSILNKTKIDKANAEIDKANVLLNDRTKAQVYVLDNNIPYIEEDVVNKKVYLRFDVIGVRGITNRTLYREQLYNELSVDAVTSPKGESNCFVLDDGYDLLYDTIGKVFKIASRHDVVSTDLVLVAQVAGSVIYLSNNLSAQYFYSKLDKIKNEDINKDIDIENVFSNSDFNALFFSDIHGSDKNLSRILKSAKSYNGRLNCILNGGDTVQYFNTTGLNWYNEQVQDFSIPVITAVGNHDAWTGDWIFDTNENIYSLITSKVKENVPSIVQPDNASGIFANYYYYDTDKVRVIVLLSMMYQNNQPFFDDNQKNWLISVLADAKTNNKAIIIMNHCPLNPSDAKEIECSWTSKKTWKTGYMHMNDTIPECVDSFIKGGGTFICYLCGHTHRDFVLQSIRYPNQVCFVTMSARYEYVEDGWRSQDENNNDFDSYNYIGVDLKNSVIKIKRIGTNVNAWMQRRNTLCWDFKNSELISDN